jgi:hypothetical protein
MTQRICLVSLLTLVGVLGCTSFQPDSGTDAARGFLSDRHWDEGKAEFQVYEGTKRFYGIERPVTSSLIVVKEPFDRRKMVKDNAGSLSVLKINRLIEIPTGMYDHLFMASLFVEIPTGRIIKYSVGSQDGCGNTYMEYRLNANQGTFKWQSYFDEEGSITNRVNMANATFYDALPVVLRYRLTETGEYSLNLVDSQIFHKHRPPRIIRATVRNGIDTYKDQQVHRVVVGYEDGEDVFYFAQEFPHVLLWWKAKDGSELALKHSYFTDYWNRTSNEDRKLVE